MATVKIDPAYNLLCKSCNKPLGTSWWFHASVNGGVVDLPDLFCHNSRCRCVLHYPLPNPEEVRERLVLL